ncbi:hypothetical protein TKK_0012143 [Trichogramma kaykai]|uniref:Adenylate kinase isoenzyme 5 n=1 Tax=Trichogramma kaykai TaxID=54128 RepID=A0ABD2WMK9_9HYME
MGICLDTDQQDGSQVLEEAGAQTNQNSEKWRREASILATPPGGNFPMQNSGPIKFEPPTVPVIFVLGGPGSGKVTHCDNLTQEKKGIVHINMTDLLQQYALGNDMQDFGLLSSKTVAEVLMLEMKMSREAKTYLVSGYPRNMRDVVEYSEKIQIVNGVILVAWKQEVLERQIEYGAQLGQVIIELARMELQNFYKNVMPVAEYFDQSEMLIMVNGERNPSEVYIDFRDAVLRTLGLQTDDGGVTREVSSSMETEVEVERNQDGGEERASPRKAAGVIKSPTMTTTEEEDEDDAVSEARISSSTSQRPTAEQIAASSPTVPSETSPVVAGQQILASSKTADMPRKRLPPVVWVLGGPGSNKSMVCNLAVKMMTNWVHLSMGSLLATLAGKNSKIRETLSVGDMANSEMVMLLVEKQILLNRDSSGIIIDGFPRDLSQAREFESKFGQRPEMLLLDVSKMQTNRGRSYDGIEAFERRLQLFRELSVPMLKSLDAENRLHIVDGDTELPADRQQFASALLELMRRAARHEDDPNRISVLTSGEENSRGPVGGLRNNAPNGVAKPAAEVAPEATRQNVAPVLATGNGAAGGRKLPAQSNGVTIAKPVSQKIHVAQRKSQQQQQSTPSPPKQQRHINGGPPHMLQNGVPPRMANGFLPNKANKVAPANSSNKGRNNKQVSVATVPVDSDPLQTMYSELENGPPTSLHF